MLLGVAPALVEEPLIEGIIVRVKLPDEVCDVVPVLGDETEIDVVTSCDGESVYEHFTEMYNLFPTPVHGSLNTAFVAGTEH